jgi:hypothetical protein
MHLLYDTIRSNASTIYVNVWSNAPIIQYYMVECIYHMRLYKRMHLPYATIWSNASTCRWIFKTLKKHQLLWAMRLWALLKWRACGRWSQVQAQFLLRPRPTVLLCVKTLAQILIISCDARCWLSWGGGKLKNNVVGHHYYVPWVFPFYYLPHALQIH